MLTDTGFSVPSRKASNERSPNRKPRYRSLIRKMDTPRDIESRAYEIYKDKNRRKTIREWKIYMYPTPRKRVSSVETLKKKINEFFSEDGDEELKTLNDFALFLGYPSKRSLLTDAKDSKHEPEYVEWLEFGIGLLNDKYEKKMLEIAMENGDINGIRTYLERQDKITEPKDNSKDINITVNIARQEKVQSALADSFSIMEQKLFAEKENAEDVKPAGLIE